MTVETPSTFAFHLTGGDRFLLEMDGGRWLLKSDRDQPGLAPDLGHAKTKTWDVVKRAWERLDDLYAAREASCEAS